MLVAHSYVRARDTTSKANKTDLMCVYLTLRSVQAVVARHSTLILVYSELFE